MKKNLYFRTVYRRDNPIKTFLYDIFFMISSWPRLLLEVFIRKNFGERYFSFGIAIIIFAVLFLYPIAMIFMPWVYQRPDFDEFLIKNLSWYAFALWFFNSSIQRKYEIDHQPSVFDFGKFSLSAGEINSGFANFKFRGKYVSARTIEVYLEPLLFFSIGCLLVFFGQSIGWLIIPCSIMYSISYMAAYHQGDNFVMDKIDELICNQEIYNAFVDGVDPSKTRGVNFYGRRPADPEVRRRVADLFTEDEEEAVDAE